jgi:exodeoxyribonuclease VII small subunit
MSENGPSEDVVIPEDVPFEVLQRELDDIVEALERGDVPVDEAIRLWQRGEALYRACAARLDAAELRVEELSRPDEPSRDTGSSAL